jgi:hypothetical protein
MLINVMDNRGDFMVIKFRVGSNVCGDSSRVVGDADGFNDI